MEESETIDEYERRLRKIKNEAINLGDAISNECLVSKVLRSLPERFRMKICAIDESKDTSILSLDELMSSLQTFELDMNMGKKEKDKSIALQVSNNSYNDFVDLTQGVNESDLGDESIALLTKQFGNYLKRMRDSKKPGQKSEKSITPTGRRPLRIGGSNQNITSSKNPLQTQKEGFGHYASECPTRLQRGMNASLSDDEDEEGIEQGEAEVTTMHWLAVLKLKESSVVTGVSTLGHNTEQKLFCLNISVPENLNDQDVCDNELSLKEAQKMYEELFTDWVIRNKSNSALSKENSELKAAVARLEVILSKKYMELYRLKEELGRATATLSKFNSSKAKLDSMLMIGQNDRTGLGFENSKNERIMLHPVFPTLHQNTSKKKNTEKNIWVPKTKSNCNVVYTSMKTNVAGQRKGDIWRRSPRKNVGKGTLNVERLPKLHNVLHVERLNANLISISQLCDDDLYVKFNKTLCEVLDKNNLCVLTGSRSSDNCYQLGEDIACKHIKIDDLDLWHQKLGHAKFKALKKLSKFEAVHGMPNLTSGVPYVCGPCQKGKQTQVSHPVLQDFETTRCLELLHMDLMGSMEIEIYGGKRYSLVCVDDFSRYSWVSFLREKSETFDTFEKLMKRITNLYNLKVVKIRTDHGKEFENSLFDQFCEKEGISHEYSAPKTPQQNGIAERKNRTLQEMARVMLSSKNIAKRFWAEALNTACHISNRVYLRKGSTMTAYEILMGKRPNLNRAYHVFNLRTRTIIESINVVFDDFADLKGKTMEDYVDDLLDNATPHTDSSVVSSVVPPATTLSTTPNSTLTSNSPEQTDEQEVSEEEFHDDGNDIPIRIQKNHPSSQIIGDA
ncbi:uncharacterized protein [Henckelia pumila]|uniref:uncharacterized protein n=1 Tax=Henckelia pumila TaxID=405737 RepID=UPI003C6E2244